MIRDSRNHRGPTFGAEDGASGGPYGPSDGGMIPNSRIHRGPTFGRVAAGDPASGGPYNSSPSNCAVVISPSSHISKAVIHFAAQAMEEAAVVTLPGFPRLAAWKSSGRAVQI